MKVYIVLQGIYEDTWPVGVYASLELAMAAHPGRYTAHEGVPRRWENDRDFSESKVILEFDLVDELK